MIERDAPAGSAPQRRSIRGPALIASFLPPLPIVIARYAFHHLLNPFAALRNMAPVCARRRSSTTESSGSGILLMPGH